MSGVQDGDAQPKRRLQAGNAERRPIELLVLLVKSVGSVVGGDAVHRAVGQARKQGLQVQKQQKQAKQAAKQQGGGSTTPNPLQTPFGGVGSTTGTTP